MPISMRTLMAAGAALVAAVAVPLPAAAQQGVKPTERWCLMKAGGPRGGGQVMECRYVTEQQCNASKTGNSDYCIRNPALGN